MKQLLNIFLLLIVITIPLSCDDDTSLPPFTSLVYLEDFQSAEDNTFLNIDGFTNVAETGTTLWAEQRFDSNGYAEFLSDTDTPSTAWLITPEIDLGTTSRTLHFQSAQHHLPQEGSALQIYISTNYNGSDISAARWIPLQAKTPTLYIEWYKFISSGEISLVGYSGKVHIAFKASHASKGAGYYVDNLKVY